MDAKGQTLYEKVAQSAFVLGVGQETQQSPDLSGERSGPVLSATFHAEKVDPRSKESVWGTHGKVKTNSENSL